MYEVILTKKAQRVYNKLTGNDFERLDNSLDSLKINPRPHGVKKIRANLYRIRIGDWRIIYAIQDKAGKVIVGKIARRSEDTYNKVNDLL